MWLINSSIGRKVLMALTGAFLILFVTFHVLMNGVALFWPTAYNDVCEFLGANWYALLGTLILAAGFALHILYAVWLTWQNRRARGGDRYKETSRPKQVEWSSKNMLVLGIVIVAFLVVHFIQFWAKMQLPELLEQHGDFPASLGTLYIQQAFSQPWTLIVYGIGFIALWLHMTHGFWSMFQSVGANGDKWICRLKRIGWWWATIVVGLFFAEGIVFTVQAKHDYYLNNERLQEQYVEYAENGDFTFQVMQDVPGWPPAIEAPCPGKPCPNGPCPGQPCGEQPCPNGPCAQPCPNGPCPGQPCGEQPCPNGPCPNGPCGGQPGPDGAQAPVPPCAEDASAVAPALSENFTPSTNN